MSFIPLVVLTLATIASIMYAFHLGQGPRLVQGWVMSTSAGRWLSRKFTDFWYGEVVPLFQALRIGVAVELVLCGLMSFFMVGEQLVTSASARTGLIQPEVIPWWTGFVVLFVAGLGAFAVWFFGRSRPVQRGSASIPAGLTQVAVLFNQVGQPPVIGVQMIDPAQRCVISDIMNDAFIVTIPTMRPSRADFNWMVRERPDHSAVINIGLATLGSLVALAATYFALGLTFGSSVFITMALVLVIQVLAIYFKIKHLVNRFVVIAANALEGVLNFGDKVQKVSIAAVAAVFTKNWAKVEEALQNDSNHQAINIINQERIEPNQRRREYDVYAAVVLWFSVAYLGRSWPFFLAVMSVLALTGGALWLAAHSYDTERMYFQENRSRLRLFVANIKERGTYLYYGMVVVMALMAAIVILVPGADERFQALREAFALLLNNSTDAATGSILTGMAYLVGIVLTSIVLYVLWPRRSGEQVVHEVNGTAITFPASEPAFPRMRKLIAAPFGIILLACVAGFVWTLVQGSVMEASATVLSRFIPTASATASPGVHLGWPSVPGATGYVIERRELHEPAYSTLSENGTTEGVWTAGTSTSPRVFVKGTTEYEDKANVVRGSKYFYRVIALGAGAGGRDVVSTETSVVVSAVAPTPPTPTRPSTGGGTPHRIRTACSTGDCTGNDPNPGLTAFCARNPAACR